MTLYTDNPMFCRLIYFYPKITSNPINRIHMGSNSSQRSFLIKISNLFFLLNFFNRDKSAFFSILRT